MNGLGTISTGLLALVAATGVAVGILIAKIPVGGLVDLAFLVASLACLWLTNWVSKRLEGFSDGEY